MIASAPARSTSPYADFTAADNFFPHSSLLARTQLAGRRTRRSGCRPTRREIWHSRLDHSASLSADAAALEPDSINRVDGVVLAIRSGSDAEIAQVSPAFKQAFQGPEDRFFAAVSRNRFLQGHSVTRKRRTTATFVCTLVLWWPEILFQFSFLTSADISVVP